MPPEIMIDGKPFKFRKVQNKFYYNLSRDKCFHRRLNIDWLIGNKLLKNNDLPLTTEWIEGSNENGKIAFIGKYDKETKKPISGGFVRCINEFGSIYEGQINSDFQPDGFCVGFIGCTNEIHMGKYKDGKREGNWVALWGEDLRLVRSGWFEKGIKTREMDMDVYEKDPFFHTRNTFLDPY